MADGSGIRAIQQKPLAPGIAGTLLRPIAAVETIVDAAVEGSREKFAQALLIDGSVSSHRDAYRLADELLAAHAQWLPNFARGKGGRIQDSAPRVDSGKDRSTTGAARPGAGKAADR